MKSKARPRSDQALLTVDEVATELGAGRTFTWEQIASGRLKAVRLGRLVRVRPADLEAYVAAHAGE